MTAWPVVLEQELRDLWLTGRGLVMMLAFSVLVSVTTYLTASNQRLNFLEQRETVGLTLQVAVAFGGFLALIGSADSISGERERATLETVLVSPVSRRGLVVAKATSALSLWFVAFIVSTPYIWFLSRGVGVAGLALGSGLLVGSLMSVFLAGLGVAVSSLVSSNRLSIAISLFVLLALYAPTQVPSSALHGWLGEFLRRADPLTAGLQVLNNVVVGGQTIGQQTGWLSGPSLCAVAMVGLVVSLGGRLHLGGSGYA